MSGKLFRIFCFLCVMAGGVQSLRAQQYTGMSGLIHVPSADMDAAGEARIGGHFLNREFLPPALYSFRYKSAYAHTASFYLSVTPFSWLELGYMFTLIKSHPTEHGEEVESKLGYYRKDRAISIKLQPIREQEGKWWPSVALGITDPSSDLLKGDEWFGGNKNKVLPSRYFANRYVAVSKHFRVRDHRFGLHLSYRDWQQMYNDIYNGVVGGITYQPSFDPNLRFIAEYTGDGVNVGFDWKLWKHLLLQSSLQDGKYFSGGLCFCINLL